VSGTSVRIGLLAVVLAGLGVVAYGVEAPLAMKRAVAAWLAANPDVHVTQIKVDAWRREIKLEGVSDNGLGANEVVVSCPLTQILPAVLSSWRHFTADARIANFSGNFGPSSATAPNIIIDGVSYDTTTGGDPVAELAGISATSVAIPEISYRYSTASVNASGEVMAINATDIVHGKIGLLAAGAMRTTTDAGAVRETINSDSLQETNFNVPAYYGFFAGRGDATAPKVRVIDGGGMTNMKIVAVTAETTVSASIDRIEIGPIDARPLKVPFWELMQQVSADPKGAMPHLLDIYHAFDAASYDIDDLKVQVSPPKGQVIGFSVQHIGMKDFGDGKIGDMSFDGISSNFPNGQLAVTKFEIGQIDANPTISAVENLALGPAAVAGGRPADRALNMEPNIGHLEFDGVELKSPDGSSRGSIGGLKIDSSDFVHGIPNHSAMKISDLVMALPGQNTGAAFLRNLGYGAVDVSCSINVNWNQDRGDLTITDGSFSMKNMFSLALNAQLHGVTRARLLARDYSNAEFTSADVKLYDDGLVDKTLDYLAQLSGGDRDAVISKLSAAYNPMITATFGAGPTATDVQTATSQFLRNPRNLEASVNSAQPVALSDWKTANWAVKANQ